MNKKSPQSNPFHVTRSHHLLEAAEDYTELVADLIQEKGEARTVEIAKRLGISHVTAIRTIRRLVRDGYLKTSPRQPVFLTAKGSKVAKKARERHHLLYDFLLKLGVPESIAMVDVEGIEHHISDRTLAAIRSFMNRGK